MGFIGMRLRAASAAPTVRLVYLVAPSCHTKVGFTAPRLAVLGKMYMPQTPLILRSSLRARVNRDAAYAWARAVVQLINADNRSSSHLLLTTSFPATVETQMTP